MSIFKGTFWSQAGADDLLLPHDAKLLIKGICSSSNNVEVDETLPDNPKNDVNSPQLSTIDNNKLDVKSIDCRSEQSNERKDPTTTEEPITDVDLTDNQSPSKDTSLTNPDTIHMEVVYDKSEPSTPKKHITPKKLQKKLESEKKRQQRQKEKEERERQRQEEKERLLAEKQKLKEEKEAEKQKALELKQKQLELKKKEKELKEEMKKKERDEKEQKRKEKEEQEAQKRREKEEERLKKLQEIEEKNKEKQKEEEKKEKAKTFFKNFFKKTDSDEVDTKVEKVNSHFMPFEVKSDMKLPPLRRPPLTLEEMQYLESVIENPIETSSYICDLKSGTVVPRRSPRTWPPGDPEDELILIEDSKALGETIHEDQPIGSKMKVKFLHFHENKRPAYYGTWRKTSKFVKPRKPFGEDPKFFNYAEDSDDDWEEEEQGESLDVSGDEEDKETNNEEDDYEVDNEFFVPHGHLSEDEIDDEENARLSPESFKQKLKLLKDEFDEDMKSKTRKLKPRFVGCFWVNAKGDNKEDPVYMYLQPFASLIQGPLEIKKRLDTLTSPDEKKKSKKCVETLPNELAPQFLKIIHYSVNKKSVLMEEFLTLISNNHEKLNISKRCLNRFLKSSATFGKHGTSSTGKKTMCWKVNDDAMQKYNLSLE